MLKDFTLAGERVSPGARKTIEIPVSVMPEHTPISLPVHVLHGRKSGPVLFVSAAVHGDEIIGIEIVRRLLQRRKIDRLRGTLLAVPIVNTMGVINRSRYLPDRRDLNRFFPGNEKGSLAARLAKIFISEIVAVSDVGIDLHSAAVHRFNLPQIRIGQDNPRLAELANAFGTPIVLESALRPGSLRQAAGEIGVDVLVYEAGEALRFDEAAVRAGVTGILRVMAHIGMLSDPGISPPKVKPVYARSRYWVRAPAGGLLRSFKTVGESVSEGMVLGAISDPIGSDEIAVMPQVPGLIIGRTNLPLVNEGDALFHIAIVSDDAVAENTVDLLSAQLNEDPMFDDDDIIY